MLIKKETYEQTCADFSWQVPDHYNIGWDICDKWADKDPNRTAIIDVEEDLSSHEVSFADLKALSNQLANALTERGVQGQGEKQSHSGEDTIGDRVGVLLPQSIETALLGFIEHFFQRRKSTVTSVTVQQPGQIPAGHRQGLCAILLCHPGPAPVSD